MSFLRTVGFIAALLVFAADFPVGAAEAGALSSDRNPSRSVSAPPAGPRSIPPGGDRLTPELLWRMGRVSEPQVSPDGQKVLFGVKWYDVAKNRGNRDLYLMNPDGSGRARITRTDGSESDAKWRPDGKKIGFLYGDQFWEMDPDGRNRKKLTNIPGGVTGFLYSPKMDRIVLAAPETVPRILPELHEGLGKSTGRILNDLMYRHWDSWSDTRSRLLIADYARGGLRNIQDMMKDAAWESPPAPFGGMEQVCWSPDGKTVAYTARKKKGREYALSTNSDIYLYDVAANRTVNLTEGMAGSDTNPAFSPDGGRIAWLSMERDGYEADENRLFLHEFAAGTRTFLTKGLDQDVSSFVWSADGRSVYFISEHRATDQIYRLDFPGGAIARLTDGPFSYTGLKIAVGGLMTTRYSMNEPEEIHFLDTASGRDRDISRMNRFLTDRLVMGKIEERWVGTTDGKSMHVWVVFPPGFDPAKKYPALLYCVGGPEVSINQNWSYRWNLQAMAARGFVVVAPNRRGVPGFGQRWKEGVLGDWGGQPMRDLLSAIDDVRKEPWVDNDRLAAVGPSFGGFSVFWLAGHHEGRFKAFIAHGGIFNLETMYLETDETWFVQSELAGPFWNAADPAVRLAYDASPHRFVQRWDTPILVIHGKKDYRVPSSQGLAAFNAAVLRGIPAELLYLPDQGHWVLSPQDSLLWHRVFFHWLDRWLK